MATPTPDFEKMEQEADELERQMKKEIVVVLFSSEGGFYYG